jgi:hypothetical protein
MEIQPPKGINFNSSEWQATRKALEDHVKQLDVDNRDPMLDEKQTLRIRTYQNVLLQMCAWKHAPDQLQSPVYAVPPGGDYNAPFGEHEDDEPVT